MITLVDSETNFIGTELEMIVRFFLITNKYKRRRGYTEYIHNNSNRSIRVDMFYITGDLIC